MIRRCLTLMIASLALSSCADKKSPSNLIAPADALSVTVDQVSHPDGCLDLAKLFNRFASLPSDSVIRQITSDLETSDLRRRSSQDERFAKELAILNFDMIEESPAEFIRYAPRFEQNGCKSGRVLGVGNAINFDIASTGPNNVELRFANRTEYYTLVGSRELRHTKQSKVLNRCQNSNGKFDEYNVRTVRTYRWGGSDLSAQSEKISSRLITALMVGLQSTPIGVAVLNSDQKPLSTVEVPIEHIKALLEAESLVEVRRCKPKPITPPPSLDSEAPPAAEANESTAGGQDEMTTSPDASSNAEPPAAETAGAGSADSVADAVEATPTPSVEGGSAGGIAPILPPTAL